MKKKSKILTITLFLFTFSFLGSAQAQYYPGTYGSSWSAPLWGGYSLYGCLKGTHCSKGERAVTAVDLGIGAIEEGVYQYESAKANREAIQEMQYRAAEANAAYNPQRNQDFQNIQNLNSFFLDTPVSPTTPTVQGRKPQGLSPQITPTPQPREFRP